MTYSGTSGEYHEWEKISDIKTVFWVVRKNGTDSDPFLLGDLNDYNFHSLGNNYLHNGHASTAYAGILRENGTLIGSPKDTAIPQTLSVVSLTSDSDLIASNFSNDRNIGGRTWKGDLAELLIYNQTLDQTDVEYIEGYLAHKWDLNGSLDNAHPYKNTPPSLDVGQSFVYGDNQLIEPYQFTFHHHLPAYLEESLISRWSFNESNTR